jgi:hypothetical protein
VRRALRHALDGTAGRDQRLANHLAAKNALPARLRRAAAKEIHLERFEIEDVEKLAYRRVHQTAPLPIEGRDAMLAHPPGRAGRRL